MSDTEDDFVTYGNALEPLDTENLPRKKPITIEEQFAYDAQGRRRFHGAFTGGFSAGYFNTVGTRDGWRPQQFKSTRINKAENVVQHPEDFMDDEDVGEFGIAPTAIRATQEYSNQTNKGTKRERYKHNSNEPIPGTPVLKELLKPIRERVGVMLLKKMGWKPGQGVGPRLTKQEKKQKSQQREKVKIYGCALPNQQNKSSDSESAGSDDEYANITFAPDDYEPFRCNPKDNYFGIGYSGLDRRPILGEHINLFETSTFNLQEKNKKLSIRGQAFGVGAFETEDDDIYAREDMSRYDFALGSQRKSKSRWSKEEAPKMSKCLEGFVPSKEQHPPYKIFAAPELPKDFQPMHKVRKSRFSPLAQESQVAQKRYEMNAESRSKIINDERPSIIDSKKVEPSNNKVAVNLITRTLNLHGREQKAERQKLDEVNVAKKTNMSWLDKLSNTTFVKGEVIGMETKVKGIVHDKSAFLNEIDKTEPNNSTSLLKFSFGDLDKQRRFEQYLKFSANERKLKLAGIQPLSMTDWDRDQEAQEFERTSRLCENIDKNAQSKCEKKVDGSTVDIKQYIESMSLEDRMAAAAEMKMFGKLTRTECEWRPAKLVCIRFNIAEPSVGVAIEDTKKKKFSIFDNLAWNEMSKFEKEKHSEEEFEPKPSTSSGFGYTDDEPDCNAGKASINVKSECVSEKENEFEESYKNLFKKEVKIDEGFRAKNANTNVEPKKSENPADNMNIQEKKDLYKSIFLSSSEESESETEEPKSMDDEKLKAALIGKRAVELNVERNTSPPRGIFAKLDLDSLLKRPEKIDIIKEKSEDAEVAEANKIDKSNDVVNSKIESKQEEENQEVKMDESELLKDVYGPALPKILLQTDDSFSKKFIFTERSTKIDEIEDCQWVEKTKNKKKSKKEKKKHKHKERSRSKSRKKSKKLKKH